MTLAVTVALNPNTANQLFIMGINEILVIADADFSGFKSLSDLIIQLPNNKILDLPKLKAFAYNKGDFDSKVKFLVKRVENIVEKEENAGLVKWDHGSSEKYFLSLF